MELDSFLEKIPNRKFYQSEFYKEYQKGLSLFWNTDYKKCVNHVVDSIVHYADHIHIQLFYRLWLEALAKQNDTASLKLLCEHLTNVAQMSHEHVIWFSLRGLVYFELDELEACALMLKGLDGVDHQYALELQQKYSSRFVSEQRNSLELLSTAQPVIDYFSLRMLADSLLVEGQIAQLWKLLDKVDQVFPHSPIKKEFQFYRDLDKRDMVGALHVIKSLSSDFSLLLIVSLPTLRNLMLRPTCLVSSFSNRLQSLEVKIFL